jgi:ubiquitin-conjugating enzyme E2 Z
MSEENCVVISKETISRLIKDVKEILKNPLESHGIYYKHDDEDLLKGKALIIGPPGTPYENGFYLFEIKYPANYPFSPPKLVYRTNDGVTRFNPNLYKCGKVCLSVLNTWRGEQWSACQTISSVLLVLCTVLNDSPLLNEPGVTKTHVDYDNYNSILKFKNMEVAIINMLTNEEIGLLFSDFSPVMKKHFLTNYDKIINIVDKEIEQQTINNKPDTNIITTSVYQMMFKINYKDLKQKLIKCHDHLNLLAN